MSFLDEAIECMESAIQEAEGGQILNAYRKNKEAHSILKKSLEEDDL